MKQIGVILDRAYVWYHSNNKSHFFVTFLFWPLPPQTQVAFHFFKQFLGFKIWNKSETKCLLKPHFALWRINFYFKKHWNWSLKKRKKVHVTLCRLPPLGCHVLFEGHLYESRFTLLKRVWTSIFENTK